MKSKENIQGWARLIAGVLGMGLFIFVLAPWIQKISAIKTVHDYIRENDMDATPLFYTESEEFSRSQSHMLDARRFQPKSR